VLVQSPDGVQARLTVGESGGYRFRLTAAGLHTLTYVPEFDTLAPIVFSTPNPRHVVITADADGNLRGFHAAHFGAHNLHEPGLPPVRFTDAPPDSLHLIDWELLEAALEGDRLALMVGYSGCDAGHRFSLWASGGFMESNPVQMTLVPVHETDEACEAYFREEKGFDLAPLRARFREAYGDNAHELLLNVVDFRGDTHQLLWNLAEDDDKPRD
jgi:hypothetical protein